MAWLVIFAHSVIPHDHVHDEYAELKSLIHSFSQPTGNLGSDVLTGIPGNDHENVCHFTENLFHQINYDVQLITSEVKNGLTYFDEPISFMFYEKDQIIPDFILYPNSLRAPPSIG